MEWRDNGRRLTRSLKHRDWRQARRQADEFAAGFAGPELNGEKNAEPEPLTLGTLFDIYGEEVTPTKGERTRRRDRVATAMFLRFFGRDRDPVTLSQRDWDRFIRARRAGRVGLSGEPVGNRTIEWDLTFLMAVLNWASRSRDEGGRLLLDRNPLKGLRKPREKNPTRVVLNEEEYRALVKVSRTVNWRFHVALVLAHETGHRIGAIRKLRWSDIDLARETIRWRSEHEKTGYEHRTPVTAEAIAALEEARRMSTETGEAPVLPASRDASKCMSRVCAHHWWSRAQTLAGLEPKRGRGWHSLRRKFASDLMDQPLKVLCELGGWKTARRCSNATRGPTRDNSGRLWRAAAEFAPDPIGGSQTAGTRPPNPVSSTFTNRYQLNTICWVGWLPSAKPSRRPMLGNPGRQNLHTRTLRSPLHAMSTKGGEAMSQELQRRTRAGPGSASGRPRAPLKGLVQNLRSRSVRVRSIWGSSSAAPAPDPSRARKSHQPHQYQF